MFNEELEQASIGQLGNDSKIQGRPEDLQCISSSLYTLTELHDKMKDNFELDTQIYSMD